MDDPQTATDTTLSDKDKAKGKRGDTQEKPGHGVSQSGSLDRGSMGQINIPTSSSSKLHSGEVGKPMDTPKSGHTEEVPTLESGTAVINGLSFRLGSSS